MLGTAAYAIFNVANACGVLVRPGVNPLNSRNGKITNAATAKPIFPANDQIPNAADAFTPARVNIVYRSCVQFYIRFRNGYYPAQQESLDTSFSKV